ncbi:MAG: isocitrate/isopropylmalate family dehydrogenase [Pseudomonadota bacterium]|nr:isocitrate/isopropylmalate family dehydrogenase [Pseudomonadota bacterium]
MKILILPGDGIGPEVVAVAASALETLNQRFALSLSLEKKEIGLASLSVCGSTLPNSVVESAHSADGVILGPVSTEDYPSEDQGGINPSAWFRKEFDLYANIRPSRVRSGVPALATIMDLVIVRENTEGFYADRNMFFGSGEFMPTEEVALAIGKATVKGCRRIAHAAFKLAGRRRKHLTAVHKANVLKHYSGMFLEQVKLVSNNYPDVSLDTVIVDAMAALLVRSPERFDVVVSTNMFGDILSDEAAELSGGLGIGASINAGEKHVIAQAVHGSAPDIAGQNIANPTGILYSTSMLLEHLGDKTSNKLFSEAGIFLAKQVDSLLAKTETRTVDLGGRATTSDFGKALITSIKTR